MKLMIDIDEETLKEVNRCGLFLNPRDKENLVNSIKHGTPIPDNATNGDMIKALFPCLEKYEYEELYMHGIALAGNDNRVTWFANEWWNSPYKRGETE